MAHTLGLPILTGAAAAGSIFMLHSATEAKTGQLRLSEHNSVAFLETILRHYARHGFSFVSLDEVLERIRKQRDMDKVIAFTFDDGYRDNLTTVLPLFERYSCPFTVYITTEIVERKAFYWWGGLREALQEHDSIAYEPIGMRLPAHTAAQKARAYNIISKHVRTGLSRPEDVERLMVRLGLDNQDLLDRDMLSRDDLRTLSNHPLVTIGGHTQTHRSLRQLPEKEAREEIARNKAYLQDCIQKPIQHFAYPFGDPQSCGTREYRLVEALGFASGVTTCRGNLANPNRLNPYALPRVLFSGLRESIGYIELQRVGLMSKARTGTH